MKDTHSFHQSIIYLSIGNQSVVAPKKDETLKIKLVGYGLVP